jgi:hypothetical protein
MSVFLRFSIVRATLSGVSYVKIFEVPSVPVFVTLLGNTEIKVRGGQALIVDAVVLMN